MRFSDGTTSVAYLAYVDRDVEISGTLTENNSYTLNLQAGWNLVRALYTYEDGSYVGALTAFRSLTPEEINDVELGSKDDWEIG